MKQLLTFAFLLFALSAFAQPAMLASSGTASAIKPTEKKFIKIVPSLQADIKQLDEAMKPYEDLVKEYNRLAGLKNHIYEVLIKAEGVDMKTLAGQPVITQDSIKLVINK